jgi:hypothetical protein
MNRNVRVIVLEFNELCPSLIEGFIRAGRLPNFERFYRESEIYTTDAEATGEDLNPWVQWVTAHTGLSVEQHDIRHLSEGHRLQDKTVWDLLSEVGRRVWVCGSMNPRCDMPIHGHLLPDPWSTGVAPQPAGEFDSYFDFVRKAVQEHSKESTGGSAREFVAYMLKHGLSFETVLRTFWQLASERVADVRWKRAMIMDRFQWDIFHHYYRRYRPDFSTFFLNSTAHYQHCYWRHMEPETFRNKPGKAELKTYGDAILQGYQNMDALVGKFLQLADQETTLVFCTALSQQPYTDHEETGGRHYYRLRRQELLRDKLGIVQPLVLEPVMAEQFFLRFDSEQEAVLAEQRLRSFHLDQESAFRNGRTQLFNTEQDGQALLCQCRCTGIVEPSASITGGELTTPVLFNEVFYQLETVKSGRHHPDGMLWIRRPERRHSVSNQKVSLRSVAPTILDMYGLLPPPAMTMRPIPGEETVVGSGSVVA